MKAVISVSPPSVPKEKDYLRMGTDICGGELYSVVGRNFLEIARDIRGEDVHAHGRGFPFPEMCSLFADTSVYTPHFNHLGSRWWTKLVRSFILGRYDVVIAQTEYGKERYIEDGLDPDKIEVLPISIDYDRFAGVSGGEGFREKYGLENEPFALSIGVRPMKNPMRVLEACREAGVTLVTLGFKDLDEADGKEWALPPREFIEEEGEDLVLPGRVPDEELMAALDAADVFVNSSDDGPECFCLAAYEAAAAGVPLCLPDFGVFDRFEGAALFHPNDEPGSLAENIRRYLDDEELREEHVEKAREVAKSVDYSNVREQFEEFYRKVGMAD